MSAMLRMTQSSTSSWVCRDVCAQSPPHCSRAATDGRHLISIHVPEPTKPTPSEPRMYSDIENKANEESARQYCCSRRYILVCYFVIQSQAVNNGIEDTEHLLLLFRAYDVHIRDLLDSVNTILRPHGLSNPPTKELLQILLYGHEQLLFDSNTNNLDATFKYIQASERFQ